MNRDRGPSRKHRAVAIRTVLGASPAAAVGLIAREGVLLAAAGLLLGLGGAAAATRWLQSQLYGVGPLDPPTFVGVGVLVAAASLVTSFLAARRAASLQPLELLRSE